MPAPPDQVDVLIRRHRGLAHTIAVGFARRLPPSVSVDELDAAGLVGLWQAIERWDSNSGVRFTTYAGQRILGEMEDWLAAEGELLNGRTVARRGARGLATPEVVQFKTLLNPDGRADTAGEWLVVARDDGPAGVDERDYLEHVLTGLTRERRMLVTLYYAEGMTMGEAGAAIGFSESRASQIMGEALAELRRRHAGAERAEAAQPTPFGARRRSRSGPALTASPS